MHRQELLCYLNRLLKPEIIKDYCPNGLQVQGKNEIRILISGVTACQALLDKAITMDADAILVHHGYFWQNEDRVITGTIFNRIATLIKHNINLFAYHLPLDLLPEYGNNAQLGQVLAIPVVEKKPLANYDHLLTIGELPQPISGRRFAQLLKVKLKRQPFYVAGSKRLIKRIAWCTGGAQNYIIEAASYNIDAYLTGEASEQTFHLANELGIHFYAAGHHATERYGVQALGAHLAEKFQLTHHFVEIENPI